MIVVTLRGDPRGKGRPRHRIIVPRPGTASWAKGKRKPFTITYTDDETEVYETALKLQARVVMGSKPVLTGPLEVTVTAVMPIPNSWPAKKRDAAVAGVIRPTGSPDWDNIAKVTDALNKVVWKDDSQVVHGSTVKVYGEQPLLRVEVRQIDGDGMLL